MIDTYEQHEPVLVYFDPERVTTPAEVCGTCSEEPDGRWVPVTACLRATANQLPEGTPNPNVLTLPPRCSSCGHRAHMERWRDEYGTGWQCHATDCLQMTVDGEDE